MSKTNAPPKSLPTLQTTDSEQSPKLNESVPALDQDHPCLTADPEPAIGASEIAALRAFFELLDQWDRNGTGE